MSALIEHYSSANRVVDTELAVTYSKTKVYGQWTYQVAIVATETRYEAWSYVRSANKTYRYVGMTKAAADACANDMRQIYLRTQKSSVLSDQLREFVDEITGYVPMADVAVNRVNGGMWEVSVNVRETDARLRFASVTASSLFADEDARDYDTN